MRNLTEHNITQAVVTSFAGTPDARLKTIMTSLVEHLHAFARETQLTEAEWLAGIRFLTATGHKCDDKRQEFILLSDVLGLSQLVVAANHSRPQAATEQTVFGPFHVPDAPALTSGEDIARGAAGEPCLVDVQVCDLQGGPVADAQVDVWQADAHGLYDVQQPDWAPDRMKLRAVFRTDAQGRVRLWTVMPEAYPIPMDGPVGQMLEATGRHPMRPAHIHFMVKKPGFDLLITHVFVAGDEWLDSDAVFGVRSSCIGHYIEHAPGVAPDGSRRAERYFTLATTLTLQPL